MRIFLLAAALVAASADRNSFDCKMRELAMEYAAYIQPFRASSTFSQLADALNGTPEKAPDCVVQNRGRYGVPGGSRFKWAPLKGGQTIYVATTGSDASGNGTITNPYATLEYAVTQSRASPGYDAIVLRAGTYYMTQTVVLGPQDTGLNIQAYPGEQVWLSGAKPLTNLQWQAYNVSATPYWDIQANMNAIFGDVPSPVVALNGTYSTYQQCAAMCEANYTAGGTCKVFTWHDANQGSYALQCYFRTDGVYKPVSESGHVSGFLNSQGKNVWMASTAGAGLTAGVPGLRWQGKRMIRARFPNSDPEVDGFGATFTASWTPQSAPRVPDIQIDLPTPVRNTTPTAFQTFTSGIGGTCDRFQPDAGYWCSTNVQGGGSVIYYVPTAMQLNLTMLPNGPYANATGAIVQTWRPGHWASWMFEVGSAVYNNGAVNFTFSSGGFQGSRGENEGEDTYIENVFEELDVPAEFYYDEVKQVLYLWHNASAGTPPPNDGSLVVPQLKWLINVTGTQANPVTGFGLFGVGLRDTAYTYMDPHGLPSGGDWSLERSAVVFLEGTVGAIIDGCVFERVDGNSIMLSAYNRNATIEYNEFYMIGQTAVALWGNTDGGDARLPEGYGQDGSAGNQPRGTRVRYNLCHELGIWEKQSSFYHQAKASESYIGHNIVFNGPRAHQNFNDGFRGGSLTEGNLYLNSCRESGDHGPFNSWDRDPYIFDLPDGTTSTVKMFEEFRNNFIIANYNSLGALDNDDGSAYYWAHDNFFVYGYGGLKNDFEGHDNIHASNVYTYVDIGISNGYGGEVSTPGKGQLDGHQSQFYNNYVLLNGDGDYSKPICSGVGKTILANNSIFSPTGNITECGTSLAAWQANGGNDPGTTAAPYPADEVVIALARQRLFV